MPSLLDQYFVQPVENLYHSALHEVSEVTHPLVHAIEGPINNVWRDSKAVVGGLYQVSQGVMHLLPYWVGGWLVYTAFQTYFPAEYRAVYRSVSNATKRMRLS